MTTEEVIALCAGGLRFPPRPRRSAKVLKLERRIALAIDVLERGLGAGVAISILQGGRDAPRSGRNGASP